MKRWYLSPIIGDGKGHRTAFRSVVPGNCVPLITIDEKTRQPTASECLVLVDSDDHDALLKELAPQGLKPLPDRGPNDKLAAMTREEKATMDEVLSEKYPLGVDREKPYAELLSELAAKQEPGLTRERLELVSIR